MLNNRIRAGVVGAIAACGFAGACVAPAASQAQPVSGSGAANGCAVYNASTGESSTVPDGTLVIALSGSIYKCSNGTWVKQPSLVRVGKPVGIGGPVLAPPLLGR